MLYVKKGGRDEGVRGERNMSGEKTEDCRGKGEVISDRDRWKARE